MTSRDQVQRVKELAEKAVGYWEQPITNNKQLFRQCVGDATKAEDELKKEINGYMILSLISDHEQMRELLRRARNRHDGTLPEKERHFLCRKYKDVDNRCPDCRDIDALLGEED